jgi:DNA-binding CsgD family transcriptional regulator
MMKYDYNALLSPNGNILFVCENALQLEQLKLDDVAGHRLWEGPWFSRTPGAPDTIRKLARHVYVTGKPKTIEITLDMLTGTRDLEYTMAPIINNDGRLFALKPEVDNKGTYFLSRREKETLSWCSKGKTAAEIAIILDISRRTVEWYLAEAKRKLGSVNVMQAIATAIKTGIIMIWGAGIGGFAASVAIRTLAVMDLIGPPGGIV